MDCERKVLDMCKKYPELEEYSEQIKEVLDEPTDVNIAILGEFNAGKTTLVNALLGKKLLPMFSTPTTAAITEIYATQDNEIKVFKEYKNDSGETKLIKIPIEDLSSEVKNAGEKKIKVFVPENNIIKKGYVIVDTPGIHSLNKMSDDITFGYLPFVDAAFILIDINQGAVPSSLREFLSKNLLGNDVLISKIMFIINRIDTKPASSLEKIRKGFIESVSEIIQDPVFIMVSAREALEGIIENNEEKRKKSKIETLENYLTDYVYKQKHEMVKERKSKELKNIFSYVRDILVEKLNTIEFSENKYAEKLKEIIEEQDEFRKKADKLKKSFGMMREEIFERLTNIINRYAATIASKIASEKKDIGSYIQNMMREIDAFIQRSIKTYFSDYKSEIETYLPNYYDLQSVKDIMSIIDKLTQFASFLIIVLLLPGARAGIELKEALPAASAILFKKAFRKARNPKLINKLAIIISDLIKSVDPVEIPKGIILRLFLKGKIESQLKSRIFEGINPLLDDIYRYAVEPALEDIKRKFESLENMYNATKKEMETKKFDVKKTKLNIENDIMLLKDCINGM